MRRNMKFSMCLAGALFLVPSVLGGAMAESNAISGPESVLIEAVESANSLWMGESITVAEHRSLVCSAMQVAIADGVSEPKAIGISGFSDCQPEESGQATVGTGDGAPVTPIVIPKTTASANDSTSPTIN